MKVSEDWNREKNEIIAEFDEFKGEFCDSLLLVGSVAMQEDDCESDIDLAVMTKNGFSFCDADRMISRIREKFGKRIHIIFMTHKMKNCLLDNGGLLICDWS